MDLTEDERQSLVAFTESLRSLGDIFHEGDGSSAALRMTIATIESAAAVLKDYADRWEDEIREDGQP